MAESTETQNPASQESVEQLTDAAAPGSDTPTEATGSPHDSETVATDHEAATPAPEAADATDESAEAANTHAAAAGTAQAAVTQPSMTQPPQMAPAREWEGVQKLSPRKRKRLIRRTILGLIVALYVAGAWFFSQHFVPGTTVDGIVAGGMTTEELAHALDERVGSYELRITDPNGFDTTVTGADISLASDTNAVADLALERTMPILWLPYMVSPQNMLIDAKVTFDEEALNTLIGDAVAAYNAEAEPPVNAAGSYHEDEGVFVISEESTGTALAVEPIVTAAEHACRELRLDTSVGSEALLQPTIAQDNEHLVAAVEQANKALQPLELKADDKTVLTIDTNTIVGWLSISGGEEPALEIADLSSWVEKNDKIKEAGNVDGEECVWGLDVKGTSDAIRTAIAEGTGGPVEIVRYVVEQKPAVTPGAKDRGRHIDVNLTTQFARFYDTDGTVIWDSYFVSGNVAEGRDTPTGEFAIEGKETGRTLIGADEDNDGKPDYESYVNYWMPFLRGDWGLHDATWRWESEFGGDTYTYNGSHGCINLPFDKAERLYNLCVVGDPVIVHY